MDNLVKELVEIFEIPTVRSKSHLFQGILTSLLLIVAVYLNSIDQTHLFKCQPNYDIAAMSNPAGIKCYHSPIRSVAAMFSIHPDLAKQEKSLVQHLEAGNYYELWWYVYVTQIYALIYFMLKVPDILFGIIESLDSMKLKEAVKLLKSMSQIYALLPSEDSENENNNKEALATQLYNVLEATGKYFPTEKNKTESKLSKHIRFDYVFTIVANLSVCLLFFGMCPRFEAFLFNERYMNYCFPTTSICTVSLDKGGIKHHIACHLNFNKILRYLQTTVFISAFVCLGYSCYDGLKFCRNSGNENNRLAEKALTRVAELSIGNQAKKLVAHVFKIRDGKKGIENGNADDKKKRELDSSYSNETNLRASVTENSTVVESNGKDEAKVKKATKHSPV